MNMKSFKMVTAVYRPRKIPLNVVLPLLFSTDLSIPFLFLLFFFVLFLLNV